MKLRTGLTWVEQWHQCWCTVEQKNSYKTQITKIYNSIVKSTYGGDTWKFNKNLESKVLDGNRFLRRSARCSKVEKKIEMMLLEKKLLLKIRFYIT